MRYWRDQLLRSRFFPTASDNPSAQPHYFLGYGGGDGADLDHLALPVVVTIRGEMIVLTLYNSNGGVDPSHAVSMRDFEAASKVLLFRPTGKNVNLAAVQLDLNRTPDRIVDVNGVLGVSPTKQKLVKSVGKTWYYVCIAYDITVFWLFSRYFDPMRLTAARRILSCTWRTQ